MKLSQEKLYGLCTRCENPKSYYDWCPPCDNLKLINEFSSWTSGNVIVNEIIRNTQKHATSYTSYLEWIPWEKLVNVKKFKLTTYCGMLEAEWIEGERITNYFRDEEIDSKRERSAPIPVFIEGDTNLTYNFSEFITECKKLYDCVKHGNRFLRFYGITQDPESSRFRIVTQFTNDGSLEDYLQKNFKTLTWQKKVDILYYIVNDIANIHKSGISHRNIHIRIRNKYSDIFNFGLIMFQLATGTIPYLTPNFPDANISIPISYDKVMRACLNNEPTKRPDLKKLQKIFNSWRQNPSYNLVNQFELSDKLDW
ncbi:kinase-like domain-containing protein [Glomus cerebriforme]|uniref:Kinase-like domain-containing protein n=1 Tax=Glomus cerebriforme TaxID=658196 RepID=A0A397S5U7_9GLOM|nr:kinase-like domain-containing protein [Glomus cerebriforme]